MCPHTVLACPQEAPYRGSPREGAKPRGWWVPGGCGHTKLPLPHGCLLGTPQPGEHNRGRAGGSSRALQTLPDLLGPLGARGQEQQKS